ncbi:MAG: succinate dehydrogenase, hydrophobic membrane anchor protein [Alphaproteobacteria bacterium]
MKSLLYIAGLMSFFAQRRGASRSWAIQRATAIVTLILGIWFVFMVVFLSGASHGTWQHWASAPLNVVLFGIFLIVSYWHGAIGWSEILTDYIDDEERRARMVRISNVVFGVFFVLGFIGLLLLSFGGLAGGGA